MPVQSQWHFCAGCHALIFDGLPFKGICPATGQGHTDVGFEFVLPHDEQPTDKKQSDWRFCSKCNAMFFNGFDRGVCPAPAGTGDRHHKPEGFIFTLPHDIPPTATSQTDWRFCEKCHVMFFDDRRQGTPNDQRKGRCAAGEVHKESGFKFVLPHKTPGP
ncbi:hypothetical protein GCM10023081_20450 [Arthrobacter ginkgonis]|uniref:Uncharacterized protein n=1 Tax=Arthrobacter ginkgonis TaxID=1630594 RepID=A0ABP7C9X7_9MICC